jgi:opacity protein-like surface antigen
MSRIGSRFIIVGVAALVVVATASAAVASTTSPARSSTNAVDIGTVTFNYNDTGASPAGTCKLSNLSGPSKLTVTPHVIASQPNANNEISGCVVSGFGSSPPIVLVTTTEFNGVNAGTNAPADIVPPPVTASDAGQSPRSVLIAIPGNLSFSTATAQWNFAAYPDS